MLAATLLSLAFPMVIKLIIEALVTPRPEQDFALLCIGAFVFVVLKDAVQYAQSYLNAWLGQAITLDLRQRFFDHLLGLPLQFYKSQACGDVASRAFNDLNQIHFVAILGSMHLIRHVLFFVGILVMIFLISPKALLLFTGVGAVIGVVTLLMSRSMRRRARKSQQSIAQVNIRFLELFPLVADIKSFCRERWLATRFAGANDLFFHAALRQAKLSSLSGPLMDTLLYALISPVFVFSRTCGGEEYRWRPDRPLS